MRRWLIMSMVALVTVGVALLLLVGGVERMLRQAADIPQGGVSFEILPGASFKTVSEQLAEAGLIRHPDWLRWYARYTRDANRIHAGQYHLDPGDTPARFLQKFVTGEVELFSFTIVEGWNNRELLSAMDHAAAIESGMVLDDWPAILQSIGATQQHPEGLFLPETYRFPKHTRDVDVLQQAFKLMQETLDEEWQQREANLPISTPYEALILASIIEKETARSDERAKIAGVFVRRLQNRMRLQTDPTVIYGLGTSFDGNLTRGHLRTDTPYNTYTRRGLPPTPIAMPGRAAIHAALHPADGKELFFVATGLADGSHAFSVTKAQHDAAVRKYLVRRRLHRNQQQGR